MGSEMARRVAMISGGTRGIGAATCLQLLRDGWALSVGVRPGRDLPPHLFDTDPERIFLHAFDAADRATHAPWVAATAQRFGQIDALVNCAGIDGPALLADATEEALDELWAINSKTPLHLIQLALPHLRKTGAGRIVNVASLSGLRVKNANVGYAMSKFALVALTHAVRQQEFAHGVRCTAICPGFVDTDMTGHVTAVPREEMTRPADVAAAIGFVLSLPNTASIAELPINWRAEDTV